MCSWGVVDLGTPPVSNKSNSSSNRSSCMATMNEYPIVHTIVLFVEGFCGHLGLYYLSGCFVDIWALVSVKSSRSSNLFVKCCWMVGMNGCPNCHVHPLSLLSK